MSRKGRNELVPELRFPEFRNEGAWKEEPFDRLYSFIVTNSLSRDKLNYAEGEVKNIHYGDIHTKFATLFDVTKEKVPYINEDVPLSGYGKESYCQEGDMVFADASEDLEGVGKGIEVYKLNKEPVLAGLHTLHARPRGKKFTRGFGGFLFLSDRVRGQIKREAQGAKVLSISGPRLSNIQISYPGSTDEQKKIAACLSSLDALLAAEREKLEALRAHKKGLMQQLFPVQGAKVPALRFPGFKGDWMEKTMADLADITTGNKDTQNKVADGSYPFFVRSQTIERINSFSYDGEAILTAGDGVGVGKVFHYINGKFDFHQRVYCIYNFKKGVSGKFVFHFFSEHFDQRVMRMTAKNSVDSVRMPMISEMPVAIPVDPAEQDAVATCLSSLDERIALQDERVVFLEEHKKGLIQGLFPAAN